MPDKEVSVKKKRNKVSDKSCWRRIKTNNVAVPPLKTSKSQMDQLRNSVLNKQENFTHEELDKAMTTLCPSYGKKLTTKIQ